MFGAARLWSSRALGSASFLPTPQFQASTATINSFLINLKSRNLSVNLYLLFHLSQEYQTSIMLFSSLGQVPVSLALLVVPTLALSIQAEQEPIRLGDCARRNATIKLYPKNPTGYPRYSYNPRSDDTRPFDTLNLSPDVCLSGDYPISQNLEIVNAPVCSDGSTAVYSIFSNRRCTGRPTYGMYGGSQIGSSWPTGPYYWSLIFRCGATPYAPVIVDVKQIDAEPPTGPTKGTIQQGSFYSCSGTGDGNGVTVQKRQSLVVDTCHTTRDFGLRIDEVATCKNGTRAQWARFSDDKCQSPMADDSLIDINDNDLRKCKALGDWVTNRPSGRPNSWKVGSMSFYCDGIQEPEDDTLKAQPAAISVDTCQVYPSIAYSPPNFRYPEPDTCVDQYGSRLKIYENAICPNGTSAILAQYRWGGCSGSPQCFTEVGDEVLDQCLATDNFQSFSFMCTGVISRPIAQPIRWQPRIDRGRERRANAIFIAGIVMLSVGIAMVLGMILRTVFKDEKRRAKVRVSFQWRSRSICRNLIADLLPSLCSRLEEGKALLSYNDGRLLNGYRLRNTFLGRLILIYIARWGWDLGVRFCSLIGVLSLMPISIVPSLLKYTHRSFLYSDINVPTSLNMGMFLFCLQEVPAQIIERTSNNPSCCFGAFKGPKADRAYLL